MARGARVVTTAIGLLVLAVFGAWLAAERGWWWPTHPDPDLYPVRGIDVSHHQGTIDWRRVAGAGIGFAYLKATEGSDFTDSRFRTNWTGAAAAGLPRGAYHYFTLCTPGRAQAAHFLATVPRDAAALPPAVDLELGGNCSARPAPAAVHREVDAFLAEVARATSARSTRSWPRSRGRPVAGRSSTPPTSSWRPTRCRPGTRCG